MNRPAWTIRPRVKLRGYRQWQQICSLRNRQRFVTMDNRLSRQITALLPQFSKY